MKKKQTNRLSKREAARRGKGNAKKKELIAKLEAMKNPHGISLTGVDLSKDPEAMYSPDIEFAKFIKENLKDK